MNIRVLKPLIVSLAMLTLVWFYGCAASGPEENAGRTEWQTAGTNQVIVVPIVILSPAGEGAPGDGGSIMPGPNSNQTTHQSEPLPLKM